MITLSGKNILISAGPMRTSLDPVRYLQNRSSGLMALELARACKSRGAEVSVILGPVDGEKKREFAEFSTVHYLGPSEYGAHLENLFPTCDLFFSLAAVLDFEFVSVDHKIERQTLEKLNTLQIPIKNVKDYVAWAATQRRKGQIVIAFAAESGSPESIVERATRKMEKKGVDAIVANPVWAGLGPEANENELWIIKPGKSPVHLGPAPKSTLALPLLEIFLGDLK